MYDSDGRAAMDVLEVGRTAAAAAAAAAGASSSAAAGAVAVGADAVVDVVIYRCGVAYCLLLSSSSLLLWCCSARRLFALCVFCLPSFFFNLRKGCSSGIAHTAPEAGKEWTGSWPLVARGSSAPIGEAGVAFTCVPVFCQCPLGFGRTLAPPSTTTTTTTTSTTTTASTVAPGCIRLLATPAHPSLCFSRCSAP